MAFDFRNWGTIQPGGTQEFLQDGSVVGAPGMYTYQSQNEALLDLSAIDYFSPIGNTLFIGDLLYLSASDGVGIFYVLAVDFETGNLIIGTESSTTGDVMGPGVSTVTAIARWNNTIGTLLSNSGVLIDNSDNITGINNLTAAAELFGNSLQTANDATIGANFNVLGISNLLQTNILDDHQVRWYLTDASSLYVGWRASLSTTQTQQYHWPVALPTANNQKFTGNTDGTTSWVDDATGLIWSVVTGASQTIAVGHGYFVNSGVLTTFTTPDTATSTIGNQFEICNLVGSGSSFRIVTPGIFDQIQVATYLSGPNNGVVDSTSEGDWVSFVLSTPSRWVGAVKSGNPDLTG